MRQAIKLIANKWIKDAESVKEFLHDCIVDLELGLGFHPDTPFEEYIFKNSGDPALSCFTDKEARKLNKALEKCFDVCRQLDLDIYELGLEITQPIFDRTFGTDRTTKAGEANTLMNSHRHRQDVSIEITPANDTMNEPVIKIFRWVLMKRGPGFTPTKDQESEIASFLAQRYQRKLTTLELELCKQLKELFPALFDLVTEAYKFHTIFTANNI